MTERNNAPDRLIIHAGNMNPESRPETLDQITKPCEGLRRQAMASPRQQQQPVELSEQGIGAAFFNDDVFTVRAADLALHSVLVET
jgi:hypothetical protein